MAQESSSKVLGVPQGAAAFVGAVIIFLSQSNFFNSELSKILAYSAPFVSAITAGVFSWIEDCVRDFLKERRRKNRYKTIISEGAEMLKDESLTADAKDKVLAAMNEARTIYINGHLSELNSDLKSSRANPASKNRAINKPKRKIESEVD